MTQDAGSFTTTGDLLDALPTVTPNQDDDIPLPEPGLRRVPFG